MTVMPTVLDQIVATKQREIERARKIRSERELRSKCDDPPPIRDFFAPLTGKGSLKLVAEVKRASPSAGIIRADFEPVEIAKIYHQHGASCVSVLTDEPYFQGRLDYLTAIKAQVTVPLLRKDFIIDTYQLLEARAAGGRRSSLDCRMPGRLQSS